MNDGGIGLGLELGLDHEAMAAPPAVVDADQLNEAIRGILMDADLEQLSRRMVRKQLEAQFQTDLSHYKDKINESILRLIEEQQQGEGEDEEDEDEPEPSDAEEDDDEDEDEEERPKPRKRAKAGAAKKKPAPKKRARRSGGNDEDGKAAGGFNMQLSLSPELASVVGAERMARPQIVKALWAYIREHELQDPNNKKTILFDDTLRRVFQRDSVTMFSMNKFVKRHVRKPEDLPANGWSDIHRDGVSSDEDEAGKAAKKKAAAKRKKKPSSGGDDGDGEKKKRANPFNTELAVSPELASVVGSDRMARPQIVKALWAYIHEHELQDPKDKRSIILDDTLRRVFQRKKFTMFSMNKYIKRHARKPQDLPAGGWDDVPRDGVSSDEDGDDDKGRAKKAKR